MENRKKIAFYTFGCRLNQAETAIMQQGFDANAHQVVNFKDTPDVLVVKAGQPVRLNFTRQETASCSEMVLFPDFDQSAKLPTGETIPIEFTPETPGEYDFQCQMGMLHGKLIVE